MGGSSCVPLPIIAGSRRPAALKFDWRQVTKQMSVVYSAVAEGRSPAELIKEFEWITTFLAAVYVISTQGFMTRLRRVGLISPCSTI
jgi:hypothetical protein